jgi:hypothetical protein
MNWEGFMNEIMKHLAGAIVVAGAILLLAGAVLAGAGIVTSVIHQNAGQQGVTEGLTFAYSGAAIAGSLGVELMGWGIVGGIIAVRNVGREQRH